MSLVKNIVNEIEKAELKPIKIEIEDAQLIRIAITVVAITAVVFAMKGFFNTITK